jgi:MarR family transcriptional regulator for hemolysin
MIKVHRFIFWGVTVSTKVDRTAAAIKDVDLFELFVLQGATSADTRNLQLGFLIHDVSRLRRNVFDQLMKPLGVTRSQWWVIAHLSRNDGMAQTELSVLLDIGKVTLGGLIDRLETGGWVQRRGDAQDRRMKRVFLTRKANNLLNEMQIVEKNHNRDILKGISGKDRDLFIDLLSRLKRNLLAD